MERRLAAGVYGGAGAGESTEASGDRTAICANGEGGGGGGRCQEGDGDEDGAVGSLRVTVVGARSLPRMDVLHSCDAYCLLSLKVRIVHRIASCCGTNHFEIILKCRPLRSYAVLHHLISCVLFSAEREDSDISEL